MDEDGDTNTSEHRERNRSKAPMAAALFERASLTNEQVDRVIERTGYKPSSIRNILNGVYRTNRTTLRVVIDEVLKSYPDLDPDLIELALDEAATRSPVRFRNDKAIRPTQPPTTPVAASPVANLFNFDGLCLLLRAANLSSAQRLALIRLLASDQP